MNERGHRGALAWAASALGRVLLGELDADAVLDALDDFDEHVAGRLLAVEPRRLALRFDLLEQAGELPTGVALVPMHEELLERAEAIRPAPVATLDAIQLATALGLSRAGFPDAVMTTMPVSRTAPDATA